jgi:hypothetical protein
MTNMMRKLGLVVLVAGTGISCGGDDGGSDLPGVVSVTEELGKSCGIDVKCEGDGLVEGNASISGVPSIDTFFQSVLNFESRANNVSAGIDEQLGAIRADFGIDAGADLKTELETKIKANVEGKLIIKAEPARCAVDAHATLEAQAKCDASIDPGQASVECSGTCEVEASASASCEGSAELQCTITAPSIECAGSCRGSCEVKLEAAAACDGTCTGECSGDCSAYSDEAGTACAGKCDGMCKGSCKAELTAEATCSGKCEGECTANAPQAGCEGAIRASCKAEANAKVACKGRCVGDFEPPKAKVECEASAKAEAKLNVECTPPKLGIYYKLKADVDVEAQAAFEAGLHNLRVRLPSLLAAVDRAKLVAQAGEGLASDATTAVGGGITAAGDAVGKGNLRVFFGLKCASEQLKDVKTAISGSSDRLTDTLNDAAALKGALGV